jgi:hypothetical protein
MTNRLAVMMPNQVSIWLIQEDPTGVKVELNVRVLLQSGLHTWGVGAIGDG